VGYDPAEPDDDHGQVNPAYSFWAVERLVRRYPRLEAGQIRPGWSGLMTISTDWQPLLGALPGSSGLYCAAGFSGRGFQLSPAVGDLMAGLIAGEAEAAELLAPFRPARLAEGQSLQVTGLGTMWG
jgi:sarcosine oxidase subunit beta